MRRDALPAVLAYHKIGTPEFGGTWCGVAQFRAHLEALAGRGCVPLDLPSFERQVAAAEAAPPVSLDKRSFLLTFDDAFASFADHAWPELERRRLPAVLFVPSAFVGARATWDLPLPGRRVAHLDWRALRDLARAGVTIGSHAATHRDLRRLGDRDLARELEGSRRCLEDALGVEVRAVAYPFGRADGRVSTATRHAGYRLGFSMCPAPSPPRVDRWALRRWGVYVTDTPGAVLDKVDDRRPGHVWQDLATRAINACAGVAARGTRPVARSVDGPESEVAQEDEIRQGDV